MAPNIPAGTFAGSNATSPAVRLGHTFAATAQPDEVLTVAGVDIRASETGTHMLLGEAGIIADAAALRRLASVLLGMADEVEQQAKLQFRPPHPATPGYTEERA